MYDYMYIVYVVYIGYQHIIILSIKKALEKKKNDVNSLYRDGTQHSTTKITRARNLIFE